MNRPIADRRRPLLVARLALATLGTVLAAPWGGAWASAAAPSTLGPVFGEVEPARDPNRQASNGAESGEEARPLLSKVVVLGASVSDGYGNHTELGTRAYVPLGTFLEAFLVEPGGTDIVELGDSNLFWSSDILGARHVSRAVAADPTAVVAVDFLFWYAFGRGRGSDERRAAGLERGLEQLERIDAPLVIGDLPDVRLALEGVGPLGDPIIGRSQIPTEEERAEFNARIRSWAEERPDVHVVSLAAFVDDAHALAPLELRGNAWRPTQHTDILQPDLLHPTERGTLWVALGALDALAKTGQVPEGAIDWDVAAAAERFDALIEPLRRRHVRDGRAQAGK